MPPGKKGAEALLGSALQELAILYVNPTGMTAGMRTKLAKRFVVHPGASWTSAYLPFIARGHLEPS